MTGNSDAAAMPPPPPLDAVADAAAPVAPPVAWGAAAAPATVGRPVPGVTGLEYAGAIPRTAAFILDGLIVGVATFVMAIALTAFGLPLLVTTLMAVVIDVAYFVWGWTRSARGTLAMGLFKLQMGRLADGSLLQMPAALTRWLAFRGWLALLALLPGIGNLSSGLSLIWMIVLLVSIVADARRLGIHDKVAGSAIVRPAGSSDSGAWVVILVFSLLPLLAVVALIFLGSQVSNILNDVGNSVGQ